jgi:hypothetical protein
MGFGMLVRRRDRQLLGSFDDVRAALDRAFPGIEFESFTPSDRPMKPRFGMLDFIHWLNDTPYPTWSGSFSGAGFAVQFDLGPNREIRYLLADIYGSGSAMLDHFKRLEEDTGWLIETPSLLDFLRIRNARWSDGNR